MTTIRWGILGPGGIATTFVQDLLIDPKSRGVTDVIHSVQAVASSTSVDSAKKFIFQNVESKQGTPCTAYGAYDELIRDSSVDIIYIATPHSHHFQCAMLCLDAGKAVLCEKPVTVNAAQAKKLCEVAEQKNCFFMEAIWTRYLPTSGMVRKHIMDGDIGEVIRMSADLSIGVPSEVIPESHRMINKNLAGGALLDLGIYPLSWVFDTLYHTLPKDRRRAPKVLGSAMTPEPRTGVDESVLILMDFVSTPSAKTKAHAVVTSAFRVDDDPDKAEHAVPAIRIQGEKGEIQVYGPIYRPIRYKVVLKKSSGQPVLDKTMEIEGMGMYFEADEAARCWRDGKLESELIPWEESIRIMEVMDGVRKQGGLLYPEEIETTKHLNSLLAGHR